MSGMVKPNKDLYDDLSSIRVDPSFDPLRRWLTKSLDHLRKENDNCMGLELTLNQGSIHTIKDILSAIDDSPEILERFTRNESERSKLLFD